MALGVRPAGDHLGHVLWRHRLRGGGEVDRVGQLGHHLPPRMAEAELVMGLGGALGLVGVPAERDLPPGRLRASPGVQVGGDQVGLGLGGAHALGSLGGQAGGRTATHGHEDLDGVLGQVEDPGVLHVVVAAPMGDVAARPQPAQHLDGLGQHLVAHLGRGPAGTHDVLVEALTGPQPEGEAPLAHHRHRGRGLGDDHRVVADGGARHHGGQLHALGRVGHRAQHRPGEGAVVLAGEPRVVVVGEHGELEAGLFGPHRVVDQGTGTVALSHQGVAESCHGAPPAQGWRRPHAGARAPGQR